MGNNVKCILSCCYSREWNGGMHCGRVLYIEGPIGKIFVCSQKIFGNSFSFQATEMALTSKWGRIQPEIQI